MDNQTASPTEPTTTTLDPILGDSPVAEPLQAEPAPETSQTEPLSEPIPEAPTAQMGRNEPLDAGALAEAPKAEPIPPEQAPAPAQPSTGSAQPEPTPAEPVVTASASTPAQAPVIVTPPKNFARLILEKARVVIQLRKQKKLMKIMGLFATKKHVTNDEVEKLLHVSDATATRYLSELEKENKIVQTGKTGHAVTYTKI